MRTKSRYRVSKIAAFRSRTIDEDIEREIRKGLGACERRIDPCGLVQTRKPLVEAEGVGSVESPESKSFRLPLDDLPPQKDPFPFRGFFDSENPCPVPARRDERIVAPLPPFRPRGGKVDIQRSDIGRRRRIPCRSIPRRSILLSVHLVDSLSLPDCEEPSFFARLAFENKPEARRGSSTPTIVDGPPMCRR